MTIAGEFESEILQVNQRRLNEVLPVWSVNHTKTVPRVDRESSHVGNLIGEEGEVVEGVFEHVEMQMGQMHSARSRRWCFADQRVTVRRNETDVKVSQEWKVVEQMMQQVVERAAHNRQCSDAGGVVCSALNGVEGENGESSQAGHGQDFEDVAIIVDVSELDGVEVGQCR